MRRCYARSRTYVVDLAGRAAAAFYDTREPMRLRAVGTHPEPMALCRRITGQEAQMELWLMIGMIIISVYFCLRH